MQLVRINANLPWRVTQDPATQRWVAACDPLEMVVEGETYSSLMEDIGDVLNALFRDLLKDGELPEFLESHGWTPNRSLAGIDPRKPVKFDVPWQPVENHNWNGQSRAVNQ